MTAAAAALARATASSTESATARVTPRRRVPSISGLPNRRSCRPAPTADCSWPKLTFWLDNCGRITAEAAGPYWRIAPTGSPRKARTCRANSEILGDKRHHPGVVWSRGDFAEDHLVAAYEQLHAKQTITSQRQHHLAGDGLGTLEGQVAHLLRLPRLAVIAVFLTMANRSAEMHAIDSADGEQGVISKSKFTTPRRSPVRRQRGRPAAHSARLR